MDADELQGLPEVPPEAVDAVTGPLPEPDVSEVSAPDVPVTSSGQESVPEQLTVPEDSAGEENNSDLSGEEAEDGTDAETAGETDGETGGYVSGSGEMEVSDLIVYQIDPDAQYHTLIDNSGDDPVPVTVMQEDPVPVVIAETLIEKEPGIMEKRLEDYTVTEGLLLLILIALVLNLVFNYGRRLY